MTLQGDQPVDEEVVAAGRQWALTRREQFRSSRRSAGGGWPGTMTEARFLVSQLALGWVAAGRRREPLLRDQERLALLLYDSARVVWLSSRTREERHE